MRWSDDYLGEIRSLAQRHWLEHVPADEVKLKEAEAELFHAHSDVLIAVCVNKSDIPCSFIFSAAGLHIFENEIDVREETRAKFLAEYPLTAEGRDRFRKYWNLYFHPGAVDNLTEIYNDLLEIPTIPSLVDMAISNDPAPCWF